MSGNAHSRASESGESGIHTIVGVSPWAKQIRDEILRVARHPSGVLICGPNGTGKELVARAIHAHSDRAGRPFIPVDCTSLTSGLFASHMFGHLKGSFTGAEFETRGCFLAADGGTIFLDEIGELELPLQAKLLRVLQERAVVPVGGVDPIAIDVRVIVATNRDLRQDVDDGRFREDLYYRLRIAVLETCPLADRPEDIEILARHFLTCLCNAQRKPVPHLSPETVQILCEHDWPGNVRELENVLERVLTYEDRGALPPGILQDLVRNDRSRPATPSSTSGQSAPPADDDLRQAVGDAQAGYGEPDAASSDDWQSLEALGREHIQKTLIHTAHNQVAAAKLLGISRGVLARLIRKHGLDISSSRRGRPRTDDSTETCEE